MHATRLSALACAALLGSLALLSCGDDEPIPSPRRVMGPGGEPSDFTPPPAMGGGGSGVADLPTSPGGQSGAGDAGGGGLPSQPGEGSGGEAPVELRGEELSFCPRLTALSKLSLAVEEAYVGTAIVDCRIAWVVPRRQDLIDMRNELITWNRRFWGCEGLPVETFPLVWGTHALSMGDATIAIDLYLAAARKELALSPAEQQEMRAALARLAQPLIASASSQPSQPSCATEGEGGSGGAGGAAGENAGGAGGAL